MKVTGDPEICIEVFPEGQEQVPVLGFGRTQFIPAVTYPPLPKLKNPPVTLFEPQMGFP